MKKLDLLPPLPLRSLPEPDVDARQVLERAAGGDNLVVLGGPGTGKTTLALQLLQTATASGKTVLLLAPTRSRAADLRKRAATVCTDAGGDTGSFQVQTPAAYALSVLSTSFAHRADPLPAPILLAGAEEDAVLAALVQRVSWPDLPDEAVRSRGFRNELRNLLARAGELGVDSAALLELSERYGIPLWRPAAGLLELWDLQGAASADRRSQTRKLDTARLQDRAADVLRNWEEDGVTAPIPIPDLVVADDYQDCTAATARLLLQLNQPDPSGKRAQIIALGDPDLAVETFRGGRPSLLVEAEDHSGLAATRMALHQGHRDGGLIHRVVDQQIERIPVAGTASHRERQLPSTAAGAEPETPNVQTLIASSPLQEVAHVAHSLRAAHIYQGIGWEQMAVISRSAGEAQRIARDLRRRGVPVSASAPAVLLRAEPAAAALLNIVQAVVGLDSAQSDGTEFVGDTSKIEEHSLRTLLLGPLVELSEMDLRRLRRQIAASQPEGSASQGLYELLRNPSFAAEFASQQTGKPLDTQAQQLLLGSEIIAALCKEGAAGADLETLLWSAWDASKKAEQWRQTSLASASDGFLAEAAEHNLDVLTVLFKRAEVWAQRHPGQKPEEFLREINAEVLPSDSVAPQGIRPPGVQVLTPASAMGREWQMVAVTGVNRDQWPNLRRRDSLTRTDLLVDAVTGRLSGNSWELSEQESRVQVQSDERRMFVAALSRATRSLLVTASNDEDNAPSNFFYEVAESAQNKVLTADSSPVITADISDLTLRGLVGQLRHSALQGELAQADPQMKAQGRAAQALLAHLATENIPGASPQEWLGLITDSSAEALRAPGERIRLSPSDVEIVTDCPLRWFLQRHGGSAGSSGAQTLGTLIHELAEKAETEQLRGAELLAEFERRLPELGYPETYFGGLEQARARNMVERLDAYFSGTTCSAQVEETINTHLDLPDPRSGETVPITIVGRIDRLEFPDGLEKKRVRVIDFKTGHVKTETEGKQNLQLRTYRRALEAQGFEVVGGALVFLNSDTKDGQPAIRPRQMSLIEEGTPPEIVGDEPIEHIDETIVKAALATLGPSYPGCGKDRCVPCQLVKTYPMLVDGKRDEK